ncbi:MAG: alpha/beta fold hydrolase [Phycisphaerales bacterium]|nr:alpha/beta fold hydrolase [Phycisphaerales bacterium]
MRTNRAKQILLAALGLLYLAALLLSHKAQPSKISAFPIELADDRTYGALLLEDTEDSQYPLFVRRWGQNTTNPERSPVILLHGSPGNADNFSTLAPILAQSERLIIAPDLPGYGRSPMREDLSYQSQARVVFLMMDALSIDRAHIIGWSSGGGVALQMAHLHPERTASITLLASIGNQETEGSGSYFFEHTKYALGLALFGYFPETVPHFGKLGTFQSRAGWLEAFWDSDQRELTRIMPTIETPTLIMHGRNDFLVPARSAEKHHELMPVYSRLVMLDASHFIPMLQAEEASEYLNNHFARHDDPTVTVLNEDIILAPEPDRHGYDRLLHAIGERIHALPWAAVLIGITLLVRFFPHLGILLTILFVVTLDIDFGVALLGILTGRVWWLSRGANILDRPWSILGWIRGLLFIIPAFVIGSLYAVFIVTSTHHAGLLGFLLATLAVCSILRFLRLGVTREGRARIAGGFGRLTNHEYWASAIIYLPVILSFARRFSLKPLARLSAVNPGYAPDGGVNEDAKSAINNRFPNDPAVLPIHFVDRNDDHARRLGQAANAVRTSEQLGGYPIIAKPDRGEHGVGVSLIDNEQKLDAYLRTHREPIVLQKYHPGPEEVGVLWVRDPKTVPDPDAPTPHGSIYAVTIKHFPVITGDGKRSIRQLILKHPRYRCQARMFLERVRHEQHRIPENNETVKLGLAGNHKQGAKFTDGEHLITPELSARIDMIARGFRDENGQGFDIGRFDLRCESHENLSVGEFGIIELNGLASEPTNLYDPERSIFWAWRVLRGYWKHAESLADARIATSTGKPIGTRSTRRKLLGWLGRGLGLKTRR